MVDSGGARSGGELIPKVLARRWRSFRGAWSGEVVDSRVFGWRVVVRFQGAWSGRALVLKMAWLVVAVASEAPGQEGGRPPERSPG